MDCEEIKKIIPAYISKNCIDTELKEIEGHLCICDNCRTFLANFMDKNTSLSDPVKRSSASHKKTGFLEYLIIIIGIVILGFLFYLLIKS